VKLFYDLSEARLDADRGLPTVHQRNQNPEADSSQKVKNLAVVEAAIRKSTPAELRACVRGPIGI
jgi:hypothetical protein